MTALEKAKAFVKDIFGTDSLVVGDEDVAQSLAAVLIEFKREDYYREPAEQLDLNFPPSIL